MSLMPKALLLIATLALAACNNPDRYGAGGAGAGGAGGAGGTGGFIDTNGLGDPSDPRSIACSTSRSATGCCSQLTSPPCRRKHAAHWRGRPNG